jgi:hypothetical protein
MQIKISARSYFQGEMRDIANSGRI